MEKVLRYGRSVPHFMAVAQAKGFYAQEGIDLEFVSGMPSYVGCKIVSSDAHAMNTFAQSDGAVVIQSLTEGLPITCVGALFFNVVGVGGLRANGIKSPKDIEGKKVAFAGGSGEALLFPVFAKLNGIDLGKVTVAYSGTGIGRLEPIPKALADGKVDMFGGYWSNLAWQLIRYEAEKGGKDTVFFKYGEYGIPGYEFCQVCNNRMIREKPKLVRGFIKATLEGLAWQLSHEAETIEASMKWRDYPRKVVEESVRSLPDSIRGPGVDRNGFGYMSMKVWQELQEKMFSAGRIIDSVELNSAITNDYLPDNPILPGGGRKG